MSVCYDHLNPLNARRKAERHRIAAALEAIAVSHGASVERREEKAYPGVAPACTALSFRLNGVGAMIDVDALHGGGWSLISWHNDYRRPGHKTGLFSHAFEVVVQAQRSASPHHKATTLPDDWADVAHALDEGLALAAANEAFI